MNNYQLLNRCKFLFEALVEISKDTRFQRNTIFDKEYKETYKSFHESLTKLTQRYFDVLSGFEIPYNDDASSMNIWQHRWHFIYKVIDAELSLIVPTKHIGLEVVFQNIRETIIANLNQASSGILIAMAWFSDNEIMQLLIEKMFQGVLVQIVISDAEENFSNNSYLRQIKNKESVIWISRKNEDDGMMHNKFCVIDKKHVITGSYNWTFKATLNLENILIVRNNVVLADEYISKFNQIRNLPETVKLEDFLTKIDC